MLALAIRYLTGCAVATDVANREKAEWPPHPARVFMALAAACFETGEDDAERLSLEWLEQQSAPALSVSEAARRGVVTHYVPVNDPQVPARIKADMKLNALRAGLAVLPEYRPKQPRSFPCVRPQRDTAYLIWPQAALDTQCLAAMQGLCEKVIRIGHSSSLVQMWIENDPPEPNWIPDMIGPLRLRVVSTGTLSYLKEQFNREAIEEYAELHSQMTSAEGKHRTTLKRQLDQRFPNGEPTSRRPVISLWQAYRQTDISPRVDHVIQGVFDRDLMVLAIHDGPVVGLETTWRLLTALRDTILDQCDPTPEWVSGHRPDQTPSQQPHLALMPLAFVGHPHADGHLLGVGLAFPKALSPRDRGHVLHKLLYDSAGNPKPIDLRLGRLGMWRIVRETRESPPLALLAQTWTRPSCSWASVTPIVLDHHPKAHYAKDRQRWAEEVAAKIAESCRRQGLPEPTAVDVGKNSWHRGVPRAVPGKTGFPLMPVKPDQPGRQQVHACLRFDRNVEGPLLLGAGRYRGYGLCKPLEGGGQ